MIQVLLRNVGGTLESNFLDRYPGTTCTVSVYTGDGAIKVDAATGTVEPVNTTLSVAASARATTVTLTSASGVKVGRRYALGTAASSAPRETVTVRYLTNSTATLFGPLMSDHGAGVVFQGTRVSLAVTSTQADVLWWDGYAVFTPADGSDPQTETVDCALRKIPEQGCDETDLLRVFPKGAAALDAELDMPGAIKEARDWFLIDLGGRGMGGRARAMTVLGTDHFRRPIAIKFWLQRRASMGEEAYGPILDKLQVEYDYLIERIQAQIPVDVDQDGTTTGADDVNYTVGRLSRA